MRTRLHRLLMLLAHIAVVRPFCHLVFGVNVHGKKNIPTQPFVIVANHNSHLDVLLAFLTVPLSRITTTHVVAAKDYFERNRLLFGFVQFLFQPVWVDRANKTESPIDAMGALLDKGHSVIVFPEGSRGVPGEVGHFRSGVGRVLQNRRDVPVIPVYMSGPERVLPRMVTCPLPVWNQVFIGQAQQSFGDARGLVNSLRDAILTLREAAGSKRHSRATMRTKPITVAILGIDGSGKSSVAGQLTHRLSEGATTCIIGDRLEVFEQGKSKRIAPLFMEWIRTRICRRAKKAASLKSYKVPKLADILIRDHLQSEAKIWYRPDVIFTDGSPLINLTAWSTLYSGEAMNDGFCTEAMGIISNKREVRPKKSPVFRRYPELFTLKRLGLTRFRFPDAVLLLDVDPKTSMDRIQRRGEARQCHETEEKLEQLRAAYKTAVGVARREFNVRAKIIDGNQSFDRVMAESLTFLAGEIGVQNECSH